MKDMGEVKQFLGLEICHTADGLEITQASYIEKILNHFNMKDCKSVSTPMGFNFKSLLGCLQYLALMTRPDICFAVNMFSQFQSNPREPHWTGLKRILRYLQGTKTIGLAYHRDRDVKPLVGYADADYGNDVEIDTRFLDLYSRCFATWYPGVQ